MSNTMKNTEEKKAHNESGHLYDPYYFLKWPDRMWLLATPILNITLLLVILYAAQPLYAEMKSVGIWNDDDIFALKCVSTALISGTMGAYMRIVSRLPEMVDFLRAGGTLFMDRLETGVGGMLGVGVYWLLQSNFFLHVFYRGSVNGLQLSFPSVGLAALLVGLLSREVTANVVRRFRNQVNSQGKGTPRSAEKNAATAQADTSPTGE